MLSHSPGLVCFWTYIHTCPSVPPGAHFHLHAAIPQSWNFYHGFMKAAHGNQWGSLYCASLWMEHATDLIWFFSVPCWIYRLQSVHTCHSVDVSGLHLSLFQFSCRNVFPFFCCYAIMRGRENKRKQVRVLNYDLTWNLLVSSLCFYSLEACRSIAKQVPPRGPGLATWVGGDTNTNCLIKMQTMSLTRLCFPWGGKMLLMWVELNVHSHLDPSAC